VVVGGDVFPAGVDPEVVLPDDVVDLPEPGLAQGMEDLIEICVARDDVDRAPRPEDAFGFLYPVPEDLPVFDRRDLDIPPDDETLVPVVVPVQPVAVDAVGGVGDDQVDRIVRDMLPCPDDAIAVVKDVAVYFHRPHDPLLRHPSRLYGGV
jgi:hypothetical protein